MCGVLLIREIRVIDFVHFRRDSAVLKQVWHCSCYSEKSWSKRKSVESVKSVVYFKFSRKNASILS